jgi:hypothetical protein
LIGVILICLVFLLFTWQEPWLIDWCYINLSSFLTIYLTGAMIDWLIGVILICLVFLLFTWQETWLIDWLIGVILICLVFLLFTWQEPWLIDWLIDWCYINLSSFLTIYLTGALWLFFVCICNLTMRHQALWWLHLINHTVSI